MNIPIQRRIITRQPYGVLGDVHPFIGRVVAKTIVIQPCFTVFILSLIAEQTITSKNAYCKITFFSLEKVIFRWQNPKNTRQCSAKGGEKKAEKNALIEAGY